MPVAMLRLRIDIVIHFRYRKIFNIVIVITTTFTKLNVKTKIMM